MLGGARQRLGFCENRNAVVMLGVHLFGDGHLEGDACDAREGLGFGVGVFGVWGLGFGVRGLGFTVRGLGLGACLWRRG